MVFHDIESLMDVLSGHRIIIYYIEGDITGKLNLRNAVESVMEMLGKKNDDMIIFKVCQNTHQFNQFKELYKPEIRGPITLFVINSDGIPLICEEIYKEDNIYQGFESICTYCKLNAISKNEVTNVINYESGKTLGDKTNTDILTNGLKHRHPHKVSEMSISDSDLPVMDSGSDINKSSEEGVQSTSTVLQIRLPDGTKEKQKFDKHAFLQEVYDFIHTKFNLNNFDLKTYDRSIFSVADYESTLQALDLTPNGVVIVVYKNVVPFNSHGSISKMMQYGFWVFFAKATSIFQYVQGILYAFWNGFFSSGTGSSSQTRNEAHGSQSGTKNSASNGVKRSQPRFGNVHTLRRNEDSDDENNRYNGNSTQQK